MMRETAAAASPREYGVRADSPRTGVDATATFAVVRDLAGLTADEEALLLDRRRPATRDLERVVAGLIDQVRTRGDDALRELSEQFDGVTLVDLEVSREARERALEQLEPALRAALVNTAENIATFHCAQLPAVLEVETATGMRVGRRADPLRRVGVYAPGGRAAYPSSVLMGVVPAKVAGVADVVVCSPPGPDGLPPAAVLAACALAGADRVFALGGAGAVAALALGTATVPRVDRIVGPGNAYVTEAKRQVTGVVATDCPAGPSEVLVIADDSADPVVVAAELLAQAEHDPDAAAVLVTTHAPLAAAVNACVLDQLEKQPRAEVIRAALRARSALLVARDVEAALAFAERYAPEHLLLMTREPRSLLPRLHGAGTIFLGASSSVVFGDYITGANHVLPTGGSARSYSGLSTLDFMRWTTYQELSPAAAASASAPTAALAEAEGLPAHAAAARLRGEAAGAGAGARPHALARAAGPGSRAAYADLRLYDPRRSPCAVDLSDNTNLFGPAPSVRATLTHVADRAITRYPSVYADELKRALAGLHGVEPANITTGCGSDDVIDATLRAYCEPNDTVAYPDPTFGMVPLFARMNATRGMPVTLTASLEVDVAGILATRAGVTYVCRPNNPTGNAFRRADVERIGRDAAGLVLIDEAYGDFCDDDMIDVAAASDRAVVLRTMSKAFGLAGLRIGYAVGPARLVAEIEKARGPYKVSAIAEACALAVLAHDTAWVRDRIADVRRNRARLLAALHDRAMPALDSAANFVLLPVPGNADAWDAALRERGVGTRPFRHLPRLGDCLRITIGDWSHMEQFLAAFDKVRGSLAMVTE